MLAHLPSFVRDLRGSPDLLVYPVPKACQRCVLGTWVPRCLGVARTTSCPQAVLAVGCSLTPGLRTSFGRVTCMAQASSVSGYGHGVPTVVWRASLGLGLEPHAHSRQRGGAEESRRDSHTTSKPRTHSVQAGKPPQSQATPRATPRGPTDRTPRDHPARLQDAQPEEADHQGHAGTDRPEENTPRTSQHRPPPMKRRVIDNGDPDTTRTAGRETEQKKKRGKERGPRGTEPDQVIATTRGPQNEGTESHTHSPPPCNRQSVPDGKAGPTPTTPTKTRGGGPAPRASPTPPSDADGSAPRERQGQTTTKVERGLPRRTGQAVGTGEGPPVPHKTATHPSRGNANRQAGVRENPTRTMRRTARSGKAGYKGSPYPHAPPAGPTKMGEVTSRPLFRHKPQPPAVKGGQRATPLPSNPLPNPQPAPKHMRTKPQPNQPRNGCNPQPPAPTASHVQDRKRAGRNPNPSTCQTRILNQEKPGGDDPKTQARAPHNSRKPSVHSPDTEAAVPCR